jgi:hypothetical protein
MHLLERLESAHKVTIDSLVDRLSSHRAAQDEYELAVGVSLIRVREVAVFRPK